MPEFNPNQVDPLEVKRAEKDRLIEETHALALELSERQEAISFPGVNEGDLESIKASEREEAEYMDNIVTIEEVQNNIQEAGGIKIFPPKKGKSAAMIIPFGSGGEENGWMYARQLAIVPDMDERLKEYILASRELFALIQELKGK
jgi:hypothetical protein